MNKKKLIIIIVSIVVFLLVCFGVFYFVTKEDKNTTLNLLEKQWVEDNKNEVIFMSILNNIPVLSHNGEGLIIEFLDSLNKDTNLSFNKVSYKLGTEPNTEYAFKFVDNLTDKDLLIYEDNYAIITKDKKVYNSLSELDGLTIGVVNENLDMVNEFLNGANVTFKTFENKDKLLEEYNKVDTTLQGIVMLKTTDLSTIMNNKYTISYNITEYTKSLVLSLGSTDKLNVILKKYYTKWSNENYNTTFNKYLSKNYFSFKGISDAEAVKFRSKKYFYGYIENAPYDLTLDSKLKGINASLLAGFSDFSSSVIHYQKYNNINEMVSAFNSNTIDLFYNLNLHESYSLDTYKTVSTYDNNYVALTNLNNKNKINSLKSLKNVITLKDTIISTKLFNVKNTYNNMNDLIKNSNDNTIVMDLNSYNYYKNELNNHVVSYVFDTSNYGFIIRDIGDNKVFNEMFNFYITFSTTNYVNEGLGNILSISKTPIILKNIAIVLGGIFVLLLLTLTVIKLKPKKKNNNLSKEDKLRYIDALTSLKNRNYLNISVQKWDSSEIYPQTIIIIDLNNVAYINDNYGHAEGDIVIKQAASILIMNQIENSEIVRTNGNEFLIYLVNAEEKQVITYMRKLTKELKELNHGFGAAIGYSMINDAIKTVDDAINEATLDMRNNKEES